MNTPDSEMIVMLECQNAQCRYDPKATGIGMKYKHYEPGKHFCPKCGAEMVTKEQYNAFLQLRRMGITPAKS